MENKKLPSAQHIFKSSYILNKNNTLSKNAFDEIKLLFPYLDSKIIIETLKLNKNSVDQTIDQLLSKDLKESEQKNENQKTKFIRNSNETKEISPELLKQVKSEIDKNIVKSEKISNIESILMDDMTPNRQENWESKLIKEIKSMEDNKKTCNTIYKSYKNNKNIIDDNETLKKLHENLKKDINYLIREKQSLETISSQFGKS